MQRGRTHICMSRLEHARRPCRAGREASMLPKLIGPHNYAIGGPQRFAFGSPSWVPIHMSMKKLTSGTTKKDHQT